MAKSFCLTQVLFSRLADSSVTISVKLVVKHLGMYKV